MWVVWLTAIKTTVVVSDWDNTDSPYAILNWVLKSVHGYCFTKDSKLLVFPVSDKTSILQASYFYLDYPSPGVWLSLFLLCLSRFGLSVMLSLISVPPSFGETYLVSGVCTIISKPTFWLILSNVKILKVKGFQNFPLFISFCVDVEPCLHMWLSL